MTSTRDGGLDTGLHTLCYRIDPDSLGDLVLYPLTAEFRAVWDAFAELIKARGNRDEITPTYTAFATALTAATNQPVRLFPRRQLSHDEKASGMVALLVTSRPIDRWIMTTALRKFEQLSTDDVNADTLAPLLLDITPQTRPVRDFISNDPGTGVVGAPSWVFEAARWDLAGRIAATPMTIDDTFPITLRLDTEGNLVAFDHPLTRPSKNTVGHATVYVSTKIITVPGATGLYLRLDGHVARHPYNWKFVKHAWLDRGDPALPIVKLPVLAPYPAKGRDDPTFKGYTAEVVESCGLHPITLPAELGATPGPVRPIGNPRKHSIGKGPGVRFLYRLGKHATRQLDAPPLRYAKTTITAGSQHHIGGPVPVDRLDDAIAATGMQHLRIACLYATPAVRRRMIDALDIYSTSGRHPLAGIADDHPVDLVSRLSVVFHNAAILLAHGPGARTLRDVPWLDASDDTGVAVLAETEWDPEDPPKDDAKHPVRRLLAARGAVAQFLNSNWSLPKARKRTVKGEVRMTAPKDEPAIAAVRDLLRSAGVIDNRLAAATTSLHFKAGLDRNATLVGIHIREHTPRRNGSVKPPARLVIRLVAMHATPDPDLPWRTETYSDQHGRWVPYRIGNAAYHATDIGTTKLSRKSEHRPRIRDHVDEALTAGNFDRDKPIVIFVDAQGCNGIWSGLNNTSFGNEILPGATLDHPDIAVVRCANGERVAQPTHRGHGRSVDDDNQPNLPRATLYEHNEGGTRSWMLAQTSRTYRSGETSARAGAAHTRWTVPRDKLALTGKDWHGTTAIEIAPASTGTWPAERLAALTARLCQQAASWDDRTQSPTPLHLAERPDLDHPQRAEQLEEADITE